MPTTTHTRAANRENTDKLLAAVLDLQDDMDICVRIEDLEIDLTPQQAWAAAVHLHLEYNALQLLPISRAVRLREQGVYAYLDCHRNYHPARLGENER